MFACATAKDFQTLMLCRFFAGVMASCPLAVVGAAFADLFGNETRGNAIAVFSAMVFIGPFISPIVGGECGLDVLSYKLLIRSFSIHHSELPWMEMDRGT